MSIHNVVVEYTIENSLFVFLVYAIVCDVCFNIVTSYGVGGRHGYRLHILNKRRLCRNKRTNIVLKTEECRAQFVLNS